MASTEMVLVLQILKNLLNTLILPAAGTWRDSVSSYSILILVTTDLSITVFLVGLWLSTWPLTLSLNVVSLRFLTFQSWTYNAVLLLLPGLILIDGLYSTRRAPHPLLHPLFTLLCWVTGASYGIRDAFRKPGPLEKEDPSSYEFPTFSVPDCVLPWISILLTTTYACSLMSTRASMHGAPVPWENRDCSSELRGALWTTLWVSAATSLAWQSPFCGLNTVLILGLDTLSTAARQVTSRWGVWRRIPRSHQRCLWYVCFECTHEASYLEERTLKECRFDSGTDNRVITAECKGHEQVSMHHEEGEGEINLSPLRMSGNKCCTLLGHQPLSSRSMVGKMCYL